MFVKIRSGNTWAVAIDSAWQKNAPFGFVVTHKADIHKMNDLFHKYQYGPKGNNGQLIGYHTVFYSKLDSHFNIDSGVPPLNPLYQTVLEQLTVQSQLIIICE